MSACGVWPQMKPRYLGCYGNDHMKTPILITVLFATLILTMQTNAQPTNASLPADSFKWEIHRSGELKYLLHLPKEYSAKKDEHWPLLLFLHGAGERGTNPDVVAVNGPPMLIEKGRDFPAIVISPQCSDSWWDYTALELFIEDRVRQYHAALWGSRPRTQP